MIIGGLDAATTSGLCILDGPKLIFAQALAAKGDSHAKIFAEFRAWLIEAVLRFKVEHIALEQPLPTSRGFTNKDGVRVGISSMNTFLLLYGLRAHAIEICETHGLVCEEINIRSWRQSIYGYSTAPKGTNKPSEWWKQQALDRCKLLGWPIEQKDAAEAALIAEYARCKPNQYSTELFDVINTKKRKRSR